MVWRGVGGGELWGMREARDRGGVRRRDIKRR